MAEDIKFSAGIDGAQWQASLVQTQASLQRSVASMGDVFKGFQSGAISSLDGVKSALGGLSSAFLSLTGLVAGGALFRSFVSGFTNSVGEVSKLSKLMGTTMEEASVLNVALALTGQTAETFSNAALKLTNRLRENEKGLKMIGLEARDAQGHLVPMQDLMQRAATLMMSYKEGVDRDSAALYLFGESAEQAMSILKLNADVMERAKTLAAEYGLVVGKEAAADVKAFKAEQAALGLVWDAVTMKVGGALMPLLKQLAGWFASVGPPAVEIFSTALKGVIEAFEWIIADARDSWIVLQTWAQQVGNQFTTLGKVISAALKWDFSDIPKAIDQGMASANALTARSLGEREKISQEYRDRITRLWAKPPEAAPAVTPPPTGGRRWVTPDTSTKPEEKLAKGWDAELSELKLKLQEAANAEKSFRQMSLQDEAAFWKEKLELTKDGTADNITVRQKIAQLGLRINQEEFAATLAKIQGEAVAYKANHDARIEILEREAALVKDRYEADSKEYAAAQAKIVQARREAADQLARIDRIAVDARRVAQMAELDIEREGLELAADLQQVTREEYFSAQQAFEQRRFEVQRQANAERLLEALAAADLDRELIARLQAEREALEMEHRGRMAKIQADAARDAAEPYRQAWSSIESGWTRTLSSIMQGTMSLRNAVMTIFTTLGGAIADLLAKLAVQWVMNKILGDTLGKAAGIANVYRAAGQAGANAVASAAAIPVYGWAMAPAAGAQAFNAAMAYMPMASAAGGWDIPAGINPLAQLHEREMVLDAGSADVIRRLRDGGEAGGGRPNGDVHIHAMDADSFRDFARTHRDTFADVIHESYRDGHRPR